MTLRIVHQVGALKFHAVRKAISFAIDWDFVRNELGYEQVDNYTPFAREYWLGDAQFVERERDLNIAKQLIIDDGWVLNADGTPYDEQKGGVRYKRVEASSISNIDKTLSNKDGSTKTIYVEDGDYYLLPLFVKQYYMASSELFPSAIQSIWVLKDIGFEIEYQDSLYNDMIQELDNPMSTLGIVLIGQRLPNYVFDARGLYIDAADELLRYKN
jgi:hypothetical protein